MWTIRLQCRRLTLAEPEDKLFIFRKWADFDFLVVALFRLRRAAQLAASVPEVNALLAPAVADFDAALPNLKKMRDVAEHFDDYAVDRGRRSGVHRQDLEVGRMSVDGTTLEWLGAELDAHKALDESETLFEAIKHASSALPPRV